jgi:Cu(I)/Ag(I) efflux system periplasmic protein CusF
MNPFKLLPALILFAASGAFAQSAGSTSPSSNSAAAAATAQSDGEVRKIDKEQGRLTLRHGPLANLDMPAMTMVFRAADPKLLEGLKEGDKVKFTAEKVNGAFTVTTIQPAN